MIVKNGVFLLLEGVYFIKKAKISKILKNRVKKPF